jgi:hypothetical protein
MSEVAFSTFAPVIDFAEARARRQAARSNAVVRPLQTAAGDSGVAQPAPGDSDNLGSLAFGVLAELLIVASTRTWKELP